MWMLVVGAIAVVAYSGMLISKTWEIAVEHERVAVAAKQAEIDEQAKKLKEAGDNIIIGMVAADEAGFARGKAQAVKAKTQGDKYVAANQNFANPACNIGDNLVQLINSESAAMRTPGAPVYGADIVPAPTSVSGRENVDGGGTAAGGPEPGRPLGEVPARPRPVDSTGQVPGGILQAVPAKPKPIQ